MASKTKKTIRSYESGCTWKTLYRPLSGQPQESSSSSVRSLSWIDYRTGEGVPGYASAIRKGLSATSGLNGLLSTLEVTSGSIYSEYTFGGDTYRLEASGCIEQPSMPTAVVGHDPEAYNAAVSAFVRHIAEFEDPVQPVVIVGELPEALRMVANRLDISSKKIAEYQAVARRLMSQRPRVRNLAKKLAELYLEYVFGWAPLLSDIDKVAGVLNNPPSPTKSITGRGSKKTIVYEDSGRVAMDGQSQNQADRYVRYEREFSVQLTGRMSRSKQKGKYRGLQGSPYSFVPSVYELIPYSFLLDYISNLGDVINGLSYQGMKLGYAVVTERVTDTYTVSLKGAGISANVPFSQTSFGGAFGYTAKSTAIQRSPFTPSVPMPELDFELPDLRQAANMVALFASRLL